MTPKRLSTGVIAYYWAPPTRARKAGCPIEPEALGTDYGTAKQRCDEVLNKHYQSWLTNGQGVSEGAARPKWDVRLDGFHLQGLAEI
jgi:hypothetical protein